MTDSPDRSAATATDRVERLINEQLRIMEKQLELLRSVEAAERSPDPGRAVPPLPTGAPGPERGGVREPQVPIAAADRAGATPLEAVGTGDERTTQGAGFKLLPMSELQRDVWITCQLSREASAAYNLTATLNLTGDLDVEALHESLRQLAQRHEALRTTFDATGEHQVVNETVEVDLPVIDLSARMDAERAEAIATFLDSELTTPYDLVTGPLFRPALIRSGEADHMLVLSAHHLVCDGTSFGVLQREVSIIYSALVRGERAALDDATQYSEFASWRQGQGAVSESYWLGWYHDAPPQLDLPVDKARPPARSFDYGTARAVIDGDLLEALRDLAVDRGVTPFIVLLAAWEILLSRLSGQREFASGVYVAGQPSMGASDLVGLCAGLLPLPARIVPDEGMSDYLTRLKRGVYDAYDHQHHTVGKLASALRLPRDPSRPMVVSTAITLETPTQGIAFEGIQAVESIHGRRSYGAFDVEAYLTESKDHVIVDLQYSRALFEPETVERWLGHYMRLVRHMTTVEDARVSDLRLLDDAERREILVRWNDTESPIPGRSIHEMFEEQAARQPDRVAIHGSGGSLTYGQLNARANQLARHLRDLGVQAERLVGVHLDRSPDMLVALLAVHKAGGAFVPLDPLFPRERLTTIATDSGLHALITQRDLADDMPAGDAVVVLVDGDASAIARWDDADLGIAPAPSDLAYVISTSGSTGRPKGVEIEHLALTNQLTAMLLEPGLEASDVLLSVTTMSFDPSLLELFGTLMVGATIELADARQTVDGIWLRDRLAAGDITVMQATPATWQMLLDAGWSGTPGLKALCGGEALSQELALAITSRVGSLWNVYGTTETTVWSSSSRVAPEGGLIPIGAPIANTEYHVLDQWREPQPPGVIGELYIGGVGLARGYRNQPDLTRDRFIMHSFDGEPPRRFYRTGDLARRLADGRIEFLGRDDFQVKIRGFRIELGEIEAVLARHPGVKECAVVARAEPGGAKRLVAYLVPTADHLDTVSELRMHLREFLPEYMVPSAFVELDALPLSTNKKVDRARLPDPDHQRPDLATELVRPRNEREAALARIWERLLDLEQVGIEDNFFDLGGNSLLALRCIIQANGAGISLTPNSIFRYQTIAELALAAEEVAEAASDDQQVVTGPTPLTPAQLRFLGERETPDVHHWNISTLVEGERMSPQVLRTAFDALLRHHDALRLRLWQEDGRWHQETAAPGEDTPFESHDLSALSGPEQIATIERICSTLQGSHDLAQGLLLKAAHFDCGPGHPDRLFVTIHHFAVDGLTWAVFWQDLEQAYRQAETGSVVSLPPKTTSIKDWATQLERLAETPRVLDTATEWLRLPWHEVARLPLDLQADRRANTNASAATVKVELGPEDTRLLLGSRVRPEQAIITALARMLSTWTSSRTVLIDLLSHGRDAVFDGVNLSRTVGFTLSYNPLVLSHPTWEGSPEILGSVAEQIERGPEGFTFELLRFLGPDPDLRARLTGLPRAEVLFNYAGAVTIDDDDAVWREADLPTGPSESPRVLRQYPIAVRATLTPNLTLTFVYSRALHRPATIEAKAAEVAATIRALLPAGKLT